MKRIKIENVMIGLFMAVSLILFGWFNLSRPSILILHSYDTEYAWVRDINIGLNRVLASKYLYRVRWYYMDTKRHPFPEFKTSAGIAARQVIEQMQPDVIIALDDDAQQYAARHFIDHPTIKIVFAGVNNDAANYGYDKARNVTGILERLPLAAMRETFQIAGNLNSLGRPAKLALLGDQSESVSGDARQVQAFNWSPIQLAVIKRVNSWPEWQAAIDTLDNQADVILLTGYRRLKRSADDKSLVPPHEVVAWTEAHSKVPVISGNGFYTEEGGMLAIGTSPYEQGEVAASMALAIAVDGKRPDSIQIVTSKEFIVTMNGSKMKARSFELPHVYEAAARTGDKYYP